MEYMNVQQAANKWGISDRRVRILCDENKIPGIIRKGRSYQIPMDAVKPVDGRKNRNKKIPEQFVSLFSRIDALKNELDNRRPLTQGEVQRLREEFLVEYTFNSNAIEGNTLTLQETAMVLEGVTIDKKPLKDHLEAVGHRDAFLYVQDIVKNKIPFTESIIKQIHTLVLMDRPEDRGVYRRIPVRILGAFHEPPEPVLVPELVDRLIKENNLVKLHPIENAALFHLKFEGIHPFIDGNGRTGRLILNLFLMQNGYLPVNVKFADRKRYYEAFDSYYRDGSSAEMTELVVEYLEERFQSILTYLK
ncbi:DNA-binding protein [Clostridium sp. KNHs205]|uniref:Fic family protein n=1 Tax=Clostridium sp. KNHs205 TaxID=1449050 RepID=UPI00051BC46F|nr:DNA-binding protein [Clostridium sp. KNHs205]